MTTIAEKVLATLKTENGNRWTLELDENGNIVVVDHSGDYRRYWSPAHPMGWMIGWWQDQKQCISIESYGALASDATQSAEAADRWRELARDRYNMLLKQYYDKSN